MYYATVMVQYQIVCCDSCSSLCSCSDINHVEKDILRILACVIEQQILWSFMLPELDHDMIYEKKQYFVAIIVQICREKSFSRCELLFSQFLRAGILCCASSRQWPRNCDLFETLFLLERTGKTSNKHLEETLSVIQIQTIIATEHFF